MKIQLVGGITNVSNYVDLFKRAEMEAYCIDGVTEVIKEHLGLLPIMKHF